jgi:hypothetical protein
LARERSDLHADSGCIGIDVRLRCPNPKAADAMEGSDSVEYRAREGLLQIIATGRRDLDDLRPEEIVIPRPRRIVVWRN